MNLDFSNTPLEVSFGFVSSNACLVRVSAYGSQLSPNLRKKIVSRKGDKHGIQSIQKDR
ncbi:MAG: hypothetical protein RLZZ29_643 [Cyanobacteriota bacterium]|jgi:hypothetical protein